MGQSLSKVYVHIIFSTKDRLNLIDENIEQRLFQYLGGICKGLECNPIQIGGFKNHVHILCLLSKNISQAKLLEEIKKQSSKWIKTIDSKYSKFYWQDGYGIYSVKSNDAESIIHYIKSQKEHHKKFTFKEELITFLKKNEIEFDEKYLFS